MTDTNDSQYNSDEENDMDMTPSADGDIQADDRLMSVARDGDVVKYHLRGMYRNWFLEYASYVILERAVPHIADGLKPVQRRILHTMKTLDDGRFNKVNNIVGSAMQYHPHGDQSITDALVQLGQKDLLVDKQGNWGNILTGASAAASRYIEARLSEFALETLYNPKITEWTPSYDGRKNEPVTLPAKFPLLLAHGAEGIAVGLSSKILPHNFNEIIDAAVAYLLGEDFVLYPDFPTGGFIDVSRYNEGRRGGAVKIRAKIEKVDNRTLAVTEIPYGKTTGIIIDSILKAYEKDKIKIRKVDDNTAEKARILVHLQPGTSSDKAIDALYAFTDCEVSVSPNCCVIDDKKPCFLGVDDLLRYSVDSTRHILEAELRVKLGELQEQRLFASLEKIFIEERIYKDKEYEQAPDIETAIRHIDSRLEKFKSSFVRVITDEDILKLVEIKMKRIFKFSSDEAEDKIADLDRRIAEVNDRLSHIVEYTIDWFKRLKTKYGEAYPRRTVIRSFDNIEAANVAEATERLYINREDGFIGTALKKDEFICNCSSLDDIIIFYKDGRYKVVKVQDKISVGKNVLYVNVFKRNDTRTIYNAIYRNGTGGIYYMKRFAVTGVTRDKEYNLTQGQAGSKVMWFSANPNGEAEVVKVTLKPKQRLKTLQFDVDFAKLAIKGKQSQGNLVTKNEVHRFSLKERGASTLGGREVWFDPDVLRLNYDGRGRLLGEFMGDDLVLVILKNGEFYTTGFEATNHYDDNILRIEKFRPKQEWTAILFDADQGYPYIKRFMFEASVRKQRFIGDNERSALILLTDTPHARFEVKFTAPDDFREPLIVEAEEFIGLKSFKAKGKRLATYALGSVTEIEPRLVDDSDADEVEEAEIVVDNDENAQVDTAETAEDISDDELRDEITGQKRIF